MSQTSIHIPRLMIAGGSSGAGKTTMMLIIAEGLRRQGLKVVCFKCGPDYLDPTYHKRQTGSCQNLDGWMMGQQAVIQTFVQSAAGADIALIEGVMGLYDSAGPRTESGSSAEIAKWLQAPVLVTLDAGGVARTIDALASGLAHYDPLTKVQGVLLNRLGSTGHLQLLKEACQTIPVIGGLPRRASLQLPERHLGLVSALDPKVLDGLHAEVDSLVPDWIDIPAVLQLARQAPDIEYTPLEKSIADADKRPCRIAYALDDCFHFYYEDNLARLRAYGAELTPFSPLTDHRLPDCDGLYLGGGYPELFAQTLATNNSLHESIREHARQQRPIYGECGGLMYLSRELQLIDGQSFPMLGLLPAKIQMHDRLQTLGYTEVELQQNTILGRAGLRFRGHQFRYSVLTMDHEDFQAIYRIKTRRQKEAQFEGYQVGQTLGSYVHAHWASNPLVCQGFINACQRVKS